MELELFKPILTFNRCIEKNILDVCQPLFKTYAITFFAHARVYQDGSLSVLASNTELFEYWLKQQYPLGVFTHPGCYLASELGNLYSDQQQNQLRENFNIDHAIYIIENSLEGSDIFLLATTPDNRHIVHFYLTYMDNIKNFLSYYKAKFINELKLAEKQKLIFPLSVDTLDSIPQLEIVSSYYFKEQGLVALTKMEQKCAALVVEGKTASEIGNLFHISKRTVEMHIKNIKTKFKCSKITQLSYLLGKMSML